MGGGGGGEQSSASQRRGALPAGRVRALLGERRPYATMKEHRVRALRVTTTTSIKRYLQNFFYHFKSNQLLENASRLRISVPLFSTIAHIFDLSTLKFYDISRQSSITEPWRSLISDHNLLFFIEKWLSWETCECSPYHKWAWSKCITVILYWSCITA